jgi:hypothetical protein
VRGGDGGGVTAAAAAAAGSRFCEDVGKRLEKLPHLSHGCRHVRVALLDAANGASHGARLFAARLNHGFQHIPVVRAVGGEHRHFSCVR